jgi:hypothetical protein
VLDGGIARSADTCDDLAAIDTVPLSHEQLRIVRVQRLQVATVVDDDRLAVTA